MYRLTLSENAAKHLPAQLPASSVRRVYRWGNLWGILHNGEWSVEERKQVQVEPYLLEEVTRLPLHAPPPAVDDVWDEEWIRVGDMEWNGTLLSVCLPGTILKQWCVKQGLPVHASISDSVSVSTSSFSVPPSKLVEMKPPTYSKPHGYSKPYTKPHSQPHTKPHFKHSKPGTCYIMD